MDTDMASHVSDEDLAQRDVARQAPATVGSRRCWLMRRRGEAGLCRDGPGLRCGALEGRALGAEAPAHPATDHEAAAAC